MASEDPGPVRPTFASALKLANIKRRLSLAHLAEKEKIFQTCRREVKSAQSIALALMTDLEAKHDQANLDGEERLLSATSVQTVSTKVRRQADTITKSALTHGAEKRQLMSAILEIRAEARTNALLPMTGVFFAIFVLTFQIHYRSYAIYMQENNLRVNLGSNAQSVSSLNGEGGVFDFVGNTFFPYLWGSKSLDPGDMVGTGRYQSFVGGARLNVIRGSSDPCIYVRNSDCYLQNGRVQDPDPVLNGWGFHRRLEASENQGFVQKLFPYRPYDQRWFASTEELQDIMPEMNPEEERFAKLQAEALHSRRLQIKRAFGFRERRQRYPSVKETSRPKSKWFSNWFPKPAVPDYDQDWHDPSEVSSRRLEKWLSILGTAVPDATGYNEVYSTTFPISMDLSDIQAQLTAWQAFNQTSNHLVSPNTVALGAEAILINEGFGSGNGIASHIFINFIFSRGGDIYTQVIIRSLWLETEKFAAFCGVLWFAILLVSFGVICSKLAVAIKNAQLGEHLSKPTTVLEWILVVLGIAICIAFLSERVQTKHFKDSYNDYLTQRPSISVYDLDDFDKSWLNRLHEILYVSGRIDGSLVLFVALYHLFIVFQFFIASQGQPRLALLANTMERAFGDIIHLVIVFMFIFSAFVISGHLFFGSRLHDFSTVLGSFGSTLQLVLQSQTNWDALTSDVLAASAVWIYACQVVVGVVVINVVLAVIFDKYEQVRLFITPFDTLLVAVNRGLTKFQSKSYWYSNSEILQRLHACKSDIITPKIMGELFKGISDEQVEQIFELSNLRTTTDTVFGHNTLIGEAVASILLGIDDIRDGVRLMQGKKFVSYRDAKIWMQDQRVAVTAPDTVIDHGPGRYLITHDRTEVRVEIDVGSQVVAILAKGTEVQVLQTLEYEQGSIRRLRAEIQDPPGWLSIHDPLSGFCWAEPYVPPAPTPEDEPGVYMITHHEAAVKADISLLSPVLDTLASGRLVKVLEVVAHYADQGERVIRTRARIEHPDGWISLVDHDEDYRFAVKSSLKDCNGRYVIIAENVLVRSGPSNKDEVVGKRASGEVVKVVEVRRYEERIEGRLDEYAGWLTLFDTKNGLRHAEFIPGSTAIPKQDLEDPARVPRNPPYWVQSGLLPHLQKQQKLMLKMTEQYRRIQLALDKQGIGDSWQLSDISLPEQLPPFDLMAQPLKNASSAGEGTSATRRQTPVVNVPRVSLQPTSQSLVQRLGHFFEGS